MAYRNVFIVNKSKLYIKDNHLVIDNGDIVAIPINDIKSLVIENIHSQISVKAIIELTRNDINVIFCNEKHCPEVNVLSLYGINDRKTIIQKQFEYRSYDKLWQKIIIQKIKNQTECLKINNLHYEKIMKISEEVQIGDYTYKESTAARIYFPILFGKNFNRRSDNNINHALNYGYSILRSQISKTLIAYGLETSIGIHHKNQFNAFNLSDDIIECFRPVVDDFVYNRQQRIKNEFDTTIKAELILLLNKEVFFENKICQVSTAIDSSVFNLKKAIMSNSDNVNLVKLRKDNE